MGQRMRWDEAYRYLTPEEKDRMLYSILEWQIDGIGIDADIRFDSDQDDVEDDHSTARLFYWEATGEQVGDY